MQSVLLPLLLLLRSPAVVFTAAKHPLSSLPDGNSQAPTRTRTRTSSSPASDFKRKIRWERNDRGEGGGGGKSQELQAPPDEWMDE